jgi:hypothetical protein
VIHILADPSSALPTDVPQSVAAVLFLVLVALMTGWLFTRGHYQDQRERGDKLEAAVDKLREALESERANTATALLAGQEWQEIGQLCRHILEAIPSADQAEAELRRSRERR